LQDEKHRKLGTAAENLYDNSVKNYYAHGGRHIRTIRKIERCIKVHRFTKEF